MSARIEEIRSGLYRATTYVEKLGLGFSQFFVRANTEEVLCIETGMRANFPQLTQSLTQVDILPSMISGIVVPHFEADEMGALPEFLNANARLTAYGHPICTHALADIFNVNARPLKDRVPAVVSGVEILPIFTKHVHQWDSLVVYLPKYKALLSSDIFMRYGDDPPAHDDPLPAIIESIERSGYLPSLAHLAAALETIRTLDLDLILPMHGPAIEHDIPRLIAGLINYCRSARDAELAGSVSR
ncbi:oxygen-binding di-iron domain-containing protein [Burkholderia alba]|uniref:MBL fold metallo-hydrolase n=1 Tax=Burkholderia alba TaxID=2683677 RepID=UPI002B061CA2|nr:MBL fold metallo-hydrolase [Burkholderia alba]